ncbi:MAG: hypothetical protein Q8N99_09020 [Nanoarchaeota archaeon]|nr:hypothetical protein [Nanoarchaeota archaeon]
MLEIAEPPLKEILISSHKQEHLSGNSIVATSRFFYINGDNKIEGTMDLRIAYSGRYSEDSYIAPSRRIDFPLTVSTLEKLDDSNIAYFDEYIFRGPGLEKHGYKSILRGPDGRLLTYDPRDFAGNEDIPNEHEGILNDIECDEDDSKLDKFGKLFSEMLRYVPAPRLFMGHPVYVGLRNNTYYKTRSQTQLPLEFLRIVRNEEIPLNGILFKSNYPSWTFPPKGNHDSRDRNLSLVIEKPHLEDLDLDPLLGDQLPLMIELLERFDKEEYLDSYLFINSCRASHSYIYTAPDGTIAAGHDRTFIKLKDYGEPISVMLCTHLPHDLEHHKVIKKLRDQTLFELEKKQQIIQAA